MLRAPLVTVLFLATATAAAQEVELHESFDGGSNLGGWSWGTGNQSVSPLNGNPGAYLQDLTLFTFLPRLGTAPGQNSPFTGDWRARQVTRVGIDLITLDTDFGIGTRYLTLDVVHDNGTPFVFDDDWGAYFVGDQLVPDPGVPIDAGWQSYDFAVPVDSDVLPEGWIGYGGLGAPGGPSFGDLVQDVSRVVFASGDPALIYLFLSWDVGADNARIAVRDCDGNGLPDFQELAAGGADLDGDGALDACQSLSADGASLSVSAGGAVAFALEAGPSHAGQLYLLLGTTSGTAPGTPLGLLTVPLNVDAYTQLTLAAPNQPPLANSFGVLDGGGAAGAGFALPAASSPALIGLVAHHAFVALDPQTAALTFASGAWPIALAP